jgi:hypothetical protein
MSTPASPPPDIRREILKALDPDAEIQRDMEAAKLIPPIGPGRKLRKLLQEHETLLDTVAHYWVDLTDRGWGVANVGVDVIQKAGMLLDGGDGEAADIVMAKWFDARWRERIVARVESLTDGTQSGRALFKERARLLEIASRQHEREEFAASIMTVLAQVEGITAQVTAPAEGGAGKLFFTKRGGRKADVVDTSDLASIQPSLDRLRDVYSSDVPEAQAKGTLSRHGILHGQELAFDTYTNSAKCWSLLDLLVQWALSRGRMRAAQVEGRRQSEFAGSQGVDELGRRLDDREFKVTRNALYEVCAAQSGYAWRNHVFNAGEATAQLRVEAMAKRGLPTPHGVTVHTAPDGSSFWAVRRTVSGWWLGRGLTLNELGFVDVWYYSGARQPEFGPSEAPDLWGGEPNHAPPDWIGGDD